MNVRKLGVPIYQKNGEEVVILLDLKLALDRDQYEKLLRKLPKDIRDSEAVRVEWLENMNAGGAMS